MVWNGKSCIKRGTSRHNNSHNPQKPAYCLYIEEMAMVWEQRFSDRGITSESKLNDIYIADRMQVIGKSIAGNKDTAHQHHDGT